MTDKQIMIDGVDVTYCEYCSRYANTTIHHCDWTGECKEHPNCYYKQLKRAEQKLAKIKKYCKPKVMMNGTANVILQIIEGKENG